MTEINKKLLALIIDNKNLKEISEELNLSPKQVCRRLDSLKNSGYNIEYTLLDSGTIEYDITHRPILSAVHSVKMKLVKKPYNFKAMVISDLHIGNNDDNLGRLNTIYEYCAQNGINIIINTGDLIDGLNTYPQYLQPFDQVEYLIKKHPYDKNILNIVCFGNHDATLLTKFGLDVSKLLCYERPDFISLGYGDSIINILQEQIFLRHLVGHNITRKKAFSLNSVQGKLILRGHSHKMAIRTEEENYILNIPTLSDVMTDSKNTLPGAVVLEISFNENGYWTNIHVEHLTVLDRIFLMNEIDFQVKNHRFPKTLDTELTKNMPVKTLR